MSDFGVNFLSNFLANLVSGALLAFVIYWIVTRPDERKREQASLKQAIGLLKTEIDTNITRAKSYIQALGSPNAEIIALLPLRYTRGAWNALKESGFLPKLNDPKLIYYLLRANEATLVANRNLRKFELSHLEGKRETNALLAQTAQNDSIHLLKVLQGVSAVLEQEKVPKVFLEETFETRDTSERD
jgi:hypothetical protein